MDRHQDQLYLNDLARRAEDKHAAQLAASTRQTPNGVRPGQIWADNDKRAHGRQVLIEMIDDTHATVSLYRSRDTDPHALWSGRITRIRLDRFKPTSTGYRLVAEAAE